MLLDGFDEVSTSERERVGQLINDFAIRYPNTRMVVTCRTAVYKPQLIPEMTQRLQLSELDDRMIRDFLTRWPEVKGPQRVQQLMESLRENPRVLQLARNPMLLTMIARMYANVGDRRQPPHSRAQFYGEATNLAVARAQGHRQPVRRRRQDRGAAEDRAGRAWTPPAAPTG